MYSKNLFNTYYFLECYMKKKQGSCPQKLQCVKCYERQCFGSTGEYVEEEEKTGIFKVKMGRKGGSDHSYMLALCNIY